MLTLQLTHDDIDGVGSAIAFNQMVDELFFISYETKVDTIKRLTKIYQPDLLIITDIGIRDSEASVLKEIKCDKIYVDHHRNNGVQASDTCTVVHNDDGNHCGTDLCYDLLGKKRDNWCELAHDYDLWIRKIPESTKLASIVNLLGPLKLMDYIHFDPYDLLDQPMFQLAIQETEKVTKKSRELAERTRLDTVIRNVPLVVCAVKGDASGVGNAISEEKNAVVVMLDITRPNILSLRTIRDDIDLSLLAGELSEGGGGHRKAAGAQLPLDAVVPCIYEYVVKLMEETELSDSKE